MNEKKKCDSDVTEDEILKVIKQLKQNKFPGDDSIVSDCISDTGI